MKLLYFNDPHFRDTAPENRLEENFLEMQSVKIEDIGIIAHSRGIKDIIIGGDIFDKWNTSYETTKHVMNLMCMAFEALDIKVHTIIGNHDCIGYNIETLKQTSLGILDDVSVIVPTEVFPLDLEYNIMVKPIHTRKNEDINTYFELVDIVGGKGKPNIILSHDTITDTDNLPFPHIYYEKLDGCADVVLCSHYHKPFIVKSKNTTFINAGAMTRLSISDDWRPAVVVFDYDADEGISNIERVEIVSAKPHSEVFRVVEDKVVKKIELPTLKMESNDLIDRIVEEGKKHKVGDVVIDESINRINTIKGDE